MSDDIVERLIGPDYYISGSADGSEGYNTAPFDAAIEIKRLREALEKAERDYCENVTREIHKDAEAAIEIKRLRKGLVAADEHAKRLEAVIEKMTVWEPSKGGRLG